MNKYSNKIKLKLPDDTDIGIMDNAIWRNVDKNKLRNIGYEGYFDCVCFNYALQNKRLQFCDTAYKYLEKYYIQVQKSDIQKDDIISFHATRTAEDDYSFEEEVNKDNARHFAVIYDIYRGEKNEIKNIIIRSKFGQDEIFEGDIKILPKMYGNCFVVWRPKNKVSPAEKSKSVNNETVRF